MIFKGFFQLSYASILEKKYKIGKSWFFCFISVLKTFFFLWYTLIVVTEMVILSSTIGFLLKFNYCHQGGFYHILKFNQPEAIMTLLKAIIDNINTLLCPVTKVSQASF